MVTVKVKLKVKVMVVKCSTVVEYSGIGAKGWGRKKEAA